MAILSKIRRWYFRDKLSIREIARRTGFSRNTVRRYLRAEIAEPLYPQRQTPPLWQDSCHYLIFNQLGR